jgi:hypothetical protein
MLTGRRVAVAVAIGISLLTGVLAGCGTVTSSPLSSGAESPPAAHPPAILVVRLGPAFSPGTLHLGVGQKFQLEVSSTVQATIAGLPAHCTSGSVTQSAGGKLSARCSSANSYLYTAEHSGSIVLAATVRPRCSPGAACAQWVAAPKLKITITS